MNTRRTTSTWWGGLFVLCAFALAGCGGAHKGGGEGGAPGEASAGGDGTAEHETLVVGSKNFTESEILGEMLALLAEAHADAPVKRRMSLGSNVVFEAARSGEVDVYVEYTGTGLVNYLKLPPEQDAQKVLATVREKFKPMGLVWLKPLGFNNTYTLTMRAEQAKALGIENISDLKAHAETLRPAFDPEFITRPDGYEGLCRHYGFRFKAVPKQVSADTMYRLCGGGEVDVIDAFSTEGSIEKFKLKVLEDDRAYFPPYDAAPLVRADALTRWPKLQAAFEKLSGQIDEPAMRALHMQVVEAQKPARQVAEEFLKKKGLLP